MQIKSESHKKKKKMGKWEPIYCSQDLIHLVYHMVGDLAYQGYWGQIHWAVRPGQWVKLGLRERLDLMFLQKANKEENCMTLRGKSKLWKFNFTYRHREAWVIWSLWFYTFCARIEILVYLKLVNRPLSRLCPSFVVVGELIFINVFMC